MDKWLSPAFITKLRSAVTYRCEHAKFLFSSKTLFHHQLLYWLNVVQCLEVALILVLLENLLDNCSIISKNCSVSTHVLISFATIISTIVWKTWLEKDQVTALSCYLLMIHHCLVSLMIPSWRAMTIKNDWIHNKLINFNLIRKMLIHSM